MGNFPLSMHDLNISSKGFKIESPQIFNLRILIMSKPWALFGLRFLMIFAISSLVNEIVERRLFVLLKESIGSLLVFSTLFSKEIVEDLSLLFKISNIIVIMINWWNTSYVFNIDQYAFGFVVGSINLVEIRE